MKISKQEIEQIANFVHSAVRELKHKTMDHDKIIVCMPFYLTEFFRREVIWPPDSMWHNPEKVAIKRFYNCKVQPHYANEVVVFYEYFYLNPEHYQPKIHTITYES